jgi:hypothetical protein
MPSKLHHSFVVHPPARRIALLLAGLTLGGVASGTPRPLAAQQEQAPPSYAGYTALQCLAAGNRIATLAQRGFDTTRFTEEHNGVIPAAREAATQCLAAGRWNVRTIDPRMLDAFFQVSLMANDTATANAALARLFSLDRTPAEQIRRLVRLCNEISVARPFNWALFSATVRRLETIPDPHAVVAAAEQWLITTSVLANEHVVDDTTAQRAIDRAEQLSTKMAPEDRANTQRFAAFMRGQFARMNGDSVLANGSPIPVTLNGQVILGPPGPYPVPNKINIVVFQSNTTPRSVAALRRLAATFGDTIAVVFLRKSAGHYKLLAPLTLEEESHALRSYYADSLRAPGSVLLEDTPIHHRPAPDDRLVYGTTPNERAFPNTGMLIVDGTGILRNAYPQSWMPYMEIRLENGIEHILRKRRQARPSPQPGS